MMMMMMMMMMMLMMLMVDFDSDVVIDPSVITSHGSSSTIDFEEMIMLFLLNIHGMESRAWIDGGDSDDATSIY